MLNKNLKVEVKSIPKSVGKIAEDVYGLVPDTSVVREFEYDRPLQDIIGNAVQNEQITQDVEDTPDTIPSGSAVTKFGEDIKDYVDAQIANMPEPMLYIGNWNASTNNPVIVSGDLSQVGHVYTVSTAGTRFGVDWSIGDVLVINNSGVPVKWDIHDASVANKLDKVTSTTSTDQAYTKLANGTQGQTPISVSGAANALAKYNTSGQLVTLAPTADTNAANKKYVDDANATKVAKAGDTMTGDLTVNTAMNVGLYEGNLSGKFSSLWGDLLIEALAGNFNMRAQGPVPLRIYGNAVTTHVPFNFNAESNTKSWIGMFADYNGTTYRKRGTNTAIMELNDTEFNISTDLAPNSTFTPTKRIQLKHTGEVNIPGTLMEANKRVATQEYVTTGLAGKQASLVSGTNIKTINSTSVLGSGNIAVQPTLVSGTNIKTVNGNSILGSGNIAISATVTRTWVIQKTVSGVWESSTAQWAFANAIQSLSAGSYLIKLSYGDEWITSTQMVRTFRYDKLDSTKVDFYARFNPTDVGEQLGFVEMYSGYASGILNNIYISGLELQAELADAIALPTIQIYKEVFS